MPDLDIVIPVYNEGDNILNVLNALCDATSTPFRVLICYDDESDDTLEALKDFKDARCEIVRVRNRGRGAHGAVVTGFSEGDAPAAIMWPADDTYNAGIIDRMYGEYLNGCHVVCASRFIDGGCMMGAPWLKSLLVRSSAFTLYYLARLPSRDASTAFACSPGDCWTGRGSSPRRVSPTASNCWSNATGWVGRSRRSPPRGTKGPPAEAASESSAGFRNTCAGISTPSQPRTSAGVRKPSPKRSIRTPDMNSGDWT